MYSAPLATMEAAATVLIPGTRRLKKRRLHPPIKVTFHPSQRSARVRDALRADRSKRYAAVANAPSISNQVTGMTQSFGWKNGFRSDEYQNKMRR